MMYEVIGLVADVGKRKHMIRATDRNSAWQRFCRAYGERKCQRVSIEEIRR